MLKGGVIMDVTTPEQARIAEEAGACAVMALERIPADIRAAGGVSRMSDPKMIKGIQQAVSIPVMAKCRIGHFVEAQILEAIVREVLASGPLEIPGLVAELAKTVTTDLSLDRIVSYALELYGAENGLTVYSAAAPSYALNVDGISYVGTAYEEWQDMMRRVDAGLDPESSAGRIPVDQMNDQDLGAATNGASPHNYEDLLAQSPLLDKAVRYYLRHIARLSSHGANYSTGFGIYTSPLYFEYAPDTFLEYLQALLSYRHINPSVVHVDVPLRFTQLPRYRDAIHNLRKSGFSLSLDGWGHDSLNLKLLHDFDCDEVRLTPSLSLQDLDSSDRKALLEATLYACRAFKKRIRLTGIHNQALFSRFAGQSDLLLEGEYFKGPFPLHDLFPRLAVTFPLPEGNI